MLYKQPYNVRLIEVYCSFEEPLSLPEARLLKLCTWYSVYAANEDINSVPLATGKINAYDRAGNSENIQFSARKEEH